MHALAFLAATLGLGAPGLKGPPVVGDWQVETMTVGGKPAAAPDPPVRWVFSDDGTRTIYKGPDKWSEGKYTADPKRAPMALDLDPEHPAGATYLCVFERDGDTLRVHVGWQGAGRPTGFECPAGSRSTVYVFKRVKKRD